MPFSVSIFGSASFEFSIDEVTFWLHFQHQRLASNMSLNMGKNQQFGSMFVMKVSSGRSNQTWFLTCPKVIAYANRLMDAACRPSRPVYQHPCFHTRLLSNHCREPK